MTKFTHLGAVLCFAGAVSFGANYSGKLMDSACYDKNAQTTKTDHKEKEALAARCAPPSATQDFALEVSGKIYKLDSNGNSKAASEFQAGSLKPDNDGDIHASVSGSLQGDTLKVDSVSAGKHHEPKVKKTG